MGFTVCILLRIYAFILTTIFILLTLFAIKMLMLLLMGLYCNESVDLHKNNGVNVSVDVQFILFIYLYCIQRREKKVYMILLRVSVLF